MGDIELQIALGGSEEEISGAMLGTKMKRIVDHSIRIAAILNLMVLSISLMIADGCLNLFMWSRPFRSAQMQ